MSKNTEQEVKKTPFFVRFLEVQNAETESGDDDGGGDSGSSGEEPGGWWNLTLKYPSDWEDF
jgi:hypothetical protein